MMRAVLLIAAGIGLVSLAGCGELPRPFAHEGPVMKNALIELPSGEGVRVVVADGLDPTIADPLRAAAVKALGDAGIPATGEATLASGYVLTGAVLVDEPDDGTPEGARFVWQLTGRDGLALGSFDKEVSGIRAGALGRDPALFEAVAKDASSQVAALLLERTGMAPGTVDGQTEAAVPAVEMALYFEGVVGAPGDGNESLARAMTSVLKRANVPMAESAAKATHLLAATVSAEPKNDGTSAIAIDWHLSARDGTDFGTITQRNPVKTALIEKRWGELAHVVAGAASDGILDALEASVAPSDAGKRLGQPKQAAK